ncbi:GNAT family N-acetyltransferase [Streptomyces johnsoniae]|uniref:GNAT family N-acetyltransferase n=1 Tax=Streptomyces johnsoniae TaxID=3075532 RepID=A0ABU2S095_9ACTN|nr:GNAT family N-acetyltransferase [Streptomyces sp. DSM 41886]MDT0442427.1 GNAT family N-acetyltransferase [Streptomyces sp. DSM 41886]
MTGTHRTHRTRRTARLRLEPIGPERENDLYRLHQDPGIARWYGAWSTEDARAAAAAMGRAWRTEGIHKWLAYDRGTGELIGRGGLSLAEVDGARRLEIGWAVREALWGRGYASEIGREGVACAFGELGATELVSFTETRNARSRAVMERLGFHHTRDIRHADDDFALYTLRPHQDGGPRKPPQHR